MSIDALLGALELPARHAALLVAIAFLAGLVRGFSGFALSALVMASAALILPPRELIPVCWWLEATASLLMVRGGFRDADRATVQGLVIGSLAGVPIGLALTSALPVETSRIVALMLILGLALLLLAKLRLAFLATRPGRYGSGLLAGIATGLASVGGMVVALYVLARQAPARQMRGSLVAFLFISSLSTVLFLVLYGLMTGPSVARGLMLAVPAGLGVIAGKRLFVPRLEPYYRPFCLMLLCGLALSGLVRALL